MEFDYVHMFLKYWYYEYIRVPAPVVRAPVSDAYPRILRWEPENQVGPVVGAVEHDFAYCRQQLEQMTTGSVLWMPFSDSRIISDHPDCIHALWISQHRYIFNYFDIVSVYFY